MEYNAAIRKKGFGLGLAAVLAMVREIQLTWGLDVEAEADDAGRDLSAFVLSGTTARSPSRISSVRVWFALVSNSRLIGLFKFFS